MKGSLHRKINKLNRIIFLFGGIFVAILLVVMYHYTNVAYNSKKDIHVLINSNIDLNNFENIKLSINDTIVLIDNTLISNKFTTNFKKHLNEGENCAKIFVHNKGKSSDCINVKNTNNKFQIVASIIKSENDTIVQLFFAEIN